MPRGILPTIGADARLSAKRCTRRASQIPIALADRSSTSRGFLHWRLSNAGPAAMVRVESSVMGPASETRHICSNVREPNLHLLDHLIGASKYRRWYADAKLLSGLQVD